MCKIAWPGQRPIKSRPGTRHVAIGSRSMLLRGLPDSLALTFLRICVSFDFPPLPLIPTIMSTAHILTNPSYIGCPRARFCPHRREEGKEARTAKEGSGEEGQDRIGGELLFCDDHLYSSLSTRIASMHMSMPTRPSNPMLLASMHTQTLVRRVKLGCDSMAMVQVADTSLLVQRFELLGTYTYDCGRIANNNHPREAPMTSADSAGPGVEAYTPMFLPAGWLMRPPPPDTFGADWNSFLGLFCSALRMRLSWMRRSCSSPLAPCRRFGCSSSCCW